MLLKLKNIAKVKSGYSFRESLDLNVTGNVSVLQSKNIFSDLEINDSTILDQIHLNYKNDNIFLQMNDIIFVSKTGPQADFRSTVFKSKKENVIFSNTMLSIRLENDEILPEYISIYLNSNECKKYLHQLNSGTHTKHILPSALLELDIPIPSLIIQQGLVNLKQNIFKQELIYQKKVDLENKIINQIFSDTINKNK